MALTDKLKAIANAIRAKTGKSGMLSLEDMPLEIDGIQSGGGDSVAVSIITKTIEEYYNNDLKMLGDYVFFDNKELKTVLTPNVETIGTSVFSGCNNLATIDFRKCKTVGDNGFYSCQRIISLDMPLLESVGQHGFSRMSRLTTVNIPLVKTIGTYGLYISSALLKADFLQLETIGANSFNASNIETLIIRTPSVCTLSNSNAFKGSPIEKGTGYIYVPKSLIEAYKSATNWTTYASQFRAIEDYPEICGG